MAAVGTSRYESMDSRFNRKHKKTDYCWGWTSSIRAGGYGYFRKSGKNISAHRFSYEKFIGKIPKNIFVCHSCDNKICVNPKHLFLGTAKDNYHDLMKKNKHNFGERNGRAKLTETIVLRIRHAEQIDVTKLAKKYGVSKSSIFRAKSGACWGRVQGGL